MGAGVKRRQVEEMTLSRRIRRLEKMHGSENTLEAELRSMSDDELKAQLDQVEEALGVEKRWDELTPQELEERLVDLQRQLIEGGNRPSRAQHGLLTHRGKTL